MQSDIKLVDQVSKEYKELEDNIRADVNHLDLKIADIETHTQTINIQLKLIQKQISTETDPIKRLNLNKAFSYLIRIYAELTSAGHGFFSSKLAYRKNQEMALRNKLKMIHIDIPKLSQETVEDLTIPKLVKLISNMDKLVNTDDVKKSDNVIVNKIKNINFDEEYSLQ
jgi:hypothetical protein